MLVSSLTITPNGAFSPRGAVLHDPKGTVGPLGCLLDRTVLLVDRGMLEERLRLTEGVFRAQVCSGVSRRVLLEAVQPEEHRHEYV